MAEINLGISIIAERLVISFKHLQFAEFQIKIGDKISFLPGHAFNKVKTMPCETFQSKKLAAAPRLGFNVSGSCIVCNNKGINRQSR